ncbi:MAG: hypothetical protein QW753_00920 [Thermofilum sp.]
MLSTSRLLGKLGRGFLLELAGAPGSGRREVLFSILRKLLEEGCGAYVDLSGSVKRALVSGRVDPSVEPWSRLKLLREADPPALISLALSGSCRVIVLDSLPRFFYSLRAERGRRWGCTAAVLSALLAAAERGTAALVVNYASRGRSFGEAAFAHYFTHRALVERKAEKGLSVRLIYPAEESWPA